MDTAEPQDEGRGLRHLPRRAKGVAERLLRSPGQTEQTLAELTDALAALRHEVAHLHQKADGLRSHVADLETEARGIRAQVKLTSATGERTAATVASLLEQVALGNEEPRLATGSDALVSVVLPVRDRPDTVTRAIDSVLAQTHRRWELLIVDDGSSPALSLGPDHVDDRIRVIRSEPGGAGAARNRAISEARGELITFLDSDNWWLPRRLEHLLASIGPGDRWAFDEQLVLDGPLGAPHVRDTHQAIDSLEEANFLDLGVVGVRADLLQEISTSLPHGPFDESLERLADWDLVLRLKDAAVPHRSGRIGQVYDGRSRGRISTEVAYGPSFHRIRRRRLGQPGAGLRILAAEWHFPQLTETYIQSDLDGLTDLGVDVEVWSDEGVAAPYEPGLPWRRGGLDAHIRDFRPHLVLSHWLHVGRDHRPITKAHDLPHAVRCHGFDYDPEIVADLSADPQVMVHLFPHLMGGVAPRPNVVVDPVAFTTTNVRPTTDKDRRLVVRKSAGLLTKDLETFFLASRLCPDFRFVLVLAHSYLVEERTEALIEQAREMEAPCEIRVDVDHEKAGALTMDAGIYLHTHGTAHPLGMPISPVEAMATGSLVLTRRLPGWEYVEGAGAGYDGATPADRAASAAALINDTLTWSDAQWADQARLALDRAWTNHPADLVAARLLERWRDRFGL